MDELSRLLAGATSGTTQAGASGQAGSGELGDLLGGLMGGGQGSLPSLLPALLALLGGQAAGGQSGLHQLISSLEQQGAGGATASWLGSGPNQAISAQQVEQAMGPANVAQLASQSGLSAGQVTQGVAAVLPSIVNGLSPTGQLPQAGQVQQILGGLLGNH